MQSRDQILGVGSKRLFGRGFVGLLFLGAAFVGAKILRAWIIGGTRSALSEPKASSAAAPVDQGESAMWLTIWLAVPIVAIGFVVFMRLRARSEST